MFGKKSWKGKAIILLVLLLSGCSQGFQNRDVKLSAYGLYAINPLYGMVGVGTIDYDRTPGTMASDQ